MYYTATQENGGNEIYGTPRTKQPQRTMEGMRYTEHHVLNSHKGQWREWGSTLSIEIDTYLLWKIRCIFNLCCLFLETLSE